MLVIADRLRSSAEKRVVAWLRKWQDDYRVPGVAIANCFVGGQEVDLVIITPHTTVVCEVKGVNPEVTGGVLQCTTNSRWKVPGYDGDPMSVRQSDTTPYDQVREAVFKLKSVAAQVGGPTFVSGLVVVIPPRETLMRLDKKSAPQGCDVLMCNTQNPLRAWFHRAHHRAAVVWTAEQAYAVVEALEHGGSTTVAELAEAGFPLESPTRPTTSPRNPAPVKAAALVAASPRPMPPKTGSAAPSRAPVPSPAGRTGHPAPDTARSTPLPPIPNGVPDATEPAPSPDIRNRAQTDTDPAHVDDRGPGPTDPSPPHPAEPTPLPSFEPAGPDTAIPDDRRRVRNKTAAALAAVAVLAAGIWFLAQAGSGGTVPHDTTGRQQNTSATEQATVQAPPPPQVAETTPPPPPHPTPTACFPFQPDC
ncbi:NERD domain-containing protein [Nocardia sp. NPDC051750]|uniref:NERD domain-containing protein n=1 Tax=Nocardia sp. NPDC051750 TaxID=3364325 RepID=UPI0037B9F66C